MILESAISVSTMMNTKNGFCSEGVCGNTHDGEGGQHEQ